MEDGANEFATILKTFAVVLTSDLFGVIFQCGITRSVASASWVPFAVSAICVAALTVTVGPGHSNSGASDEGGAGTRWSRGVNWVFWGGGSGVSWVGGVGVLSAIGFGIARNGENDVVLSVEFALFFGELASGGV